jgi:hypothetical protein
MVQEMQLSFLVASECSESEISDSSLASLSCANAFFMCFTSLSSFFTLLAWLERDFSSLSSPFGQCVDGCPG